MKLDADLKVRIKMEGQYLPEFDHDADDTLLPGTKSTYIEANSGSTFLISIHFGPGFQYMDEEIDCVVYLDGKFAATTIARPRRHPRSTIEGVKSCEAGQWTLKRFLFADLHTNDQEPEDKMRETLKDIGTIRVTFSRIVVTGSGEQRDRSSHFRTIGDEIPEKALKGRAISNQTMLGEAESSNPIRYVSVAYPYGKDPFTTSIFRYRSRRDLEIERIVPRSPTPVPLEDRDPDSLSVEEARELVRRLREGRTKVDVKKEKRESATTVDGDDNDGDEVIIESSSRGRKRPRAVPGPGVEIVDLSED